MAADFHSTTLQARQAQRQSAARAAEERSHWRREADKRRALVVEQLAASQDLLRSTQADAEKATDIEQSLRRRLNDTELAAGAKLSEDEYGKSREVECSSV